MVSKRVMTVQQRNRRLASAALSAVLTVSCALPVYGADTVGDGRSVQCDEAYYATLDYYGNLAEGSVVKSYVLNGADEVSDYGTYESVSNLTDDTEPAEEGGRLVFRFPGGSPPTHFYFEGKTAQPYEKLPWKLSVRYTLNGVPARAEDLAGKTGVVEILVDAVPNEEADEYARRNYVLSANAAFNQDEIVSLEAPGAQVQLVGNLRVALFLCLPGEEGHFVIRVGAESFTFAGMTFLLMPAALSQLEQVADLSRQRDDIEDNYHKLSGSLDELLDALDDVSSSLYGSAGGLDALNSARGTVSEGKDAVYDAGDVVRGDLDLVNDALKPVTDDLENVSALVTDLDGTVRQLTNKTVALRGDLETLQTLLEDARPRKTDLLGVFGNLTELDEELYDLYLALDDTSLRSVPLINRSDFPQVKNSVSGSLTTVNGLYQLLHAAYAMNNTGDSMNLAQFSVAAMMVKLLTADQAAAAARVGETNALVTAYGAKKLAGKTDAEAVAETAAENDVSVTVVQDALKTAQKLSALTVPITGFDGFLDAMAALAGDDDPTQAAELKEIANIYRDNPYAFDALADTDGLKGDIIDAAGDVDADIGSAVSKANASIREVNRSISTISDLLQPTADVVKELDELVSELNALKPLVNTADGLVGLGIEDAEKVRDILDSVEKLQGVLDVYEPKTQEALTNVTALIGTTQDSLTHIGAFSDTLKDLMQRSGTELDAATKKSLGNLAASLRQTARALEKNNGVRSAKDTISDIVEDLWDEHTGELDNLLLMDVTAETVSLTSPRNPSPQSVQLLLRTQEIESGGEESAEQTAEAEAEPLTFLGRISKMLRDFWAAITGLFRGRG